MSYIFGNNGKVAGVEANPLVVTLAGGGTAPGGGSGSSKYPESVITIAASTALTGSGSYVATDNVTITLSLSDNGTNPDTLFTGYIKLGADPEMTISGFKRTGGYDEVTAAAPNNVVSWEVPAGYTFVLRYVATTAGTRSAKGTVTLS